MSKKDEFGSFMELTQGIKPLSQDKVELRQPKQVKKQRQQEKQQQKQSEFYFSDGFVPHIEQDGPMRYCAPDIDTYELKKLRRGDYYPELILDLHGLSQNEAKREILALFRECRKQNIHCACIVHGIGSGVLKRQTPLWLAQHPDLLAFHQASLEWGGKGALLLLLKTDNDEFAK